MSNLTTPTAPVAALERQFRALRLLASGAVLASCGALAIAVLAVSRAPGAATSATPTQLDELTVNRLNIVEPDGTPRMIIASRALFPGSFARGKEIARPDRRDQAGILFVDDEGTENGGLLQSGQLDKDGNVKAGLSLTFDRFRQDQMLQLFLEENGDDAGAGVRINDLPSYKLLDLTGLMLEAEHLTPAERDALFKRHQALGHSSHPRGFFGTHAGSARLALDDPQGRPRLVLSVSPQGEPSIALLDEAGKTVRTIDPHTP